MKIDRIYYINLTKDQERRELIESRIIKYFPDIRFTRFNAISPEEIYEQEEFFRDRLIGELKAVNGRYPYPGTIGCYLSHYFVLKQIERAPGKINDDNAILVLQDDCVFDNTVYPFIKNRIDSYLPKEWKIIKHSLGNTDKNDIVNKIFFDIGGAKFKNWDYYWGAHFLIYNGNAVKDIIRKMETSTISRGYDVWIRDNVDCVYSFVKNIHIKQSNLGGSNTNPDFSESDHEDRGFRFNEFHIRRRLKKLFVDSFEKIGIKCGE